MGAAILCAAPISLHHSQVKGLSLSLDSADARVGHPATATNVAGVHRRATRRAVRRCVAGVCSYLLMKFHRMRLVVR